MKKTIYTLCTFLLLFGLIGCSSTKNITTEEIYNPSQRYEKINDTFYFEYNTMNTFSEIQMSDLDIYIKQIEEYTNSNIYILVDKNEANVQINDAELFFKENTSFITEKDLVLSIKNNKVDYYIGENSCIAPEDIISKITIAVEENIWTTENACNEFIMNFLKQYAKFIEKDYRGINKK